VDRLLPTGRRLPACWQVVRRQRSEEDADCSTVRLMDASALSSDERVLSTMIFRNADPLTPVNPSCSEPLSLGRPSPRKHLRNRTAFVDRSYLLWRQPELRKKSRRLLLDGLAERGERERQSKAGTRKGLEHHVSTRFRASDKNGGVTMDALHTRELVHRLQAGGCSRGIWDAIVNQA